MRRPVYGFGLAFCLACLAGAFVPLPALWLAAAFSQGPLRCSGAAGRGPGAACPFVCCAAARPCLCAARRIYVGGGAARRGACGHHGAGAGRGAADPASYLPGSVNATVRITQIDGRPARFRRILEAVPGLAEGDIFTAQLEFSAPENTGYARARRADGVYIDAAVQRVAVVGRRGGIPAQRGRCVTRCAARLTRMLGQRWAVWRARPHLVTKAH